VRRLEILEDRTVPSNTLGPLIDLSDPDVLAACGSNGAEKESYIVVNPANPKNIVATWFGGQALGTVTAVSLDGGNNWQQVIVPGATRCTGGTPEFQNVADPWLTFAPNGDLYHSSLPFNIAGGPSGVLVSKSVDGGLDWTSRFLLDEATDKHTEIDKDSVTADPADSRFVYAVWTQASVGGSNPYYNVGHGVLRFSRSTDGGANWEPARTIFDPGSNNRAFDAEVVVLPDGTLAALFVDLLFTNPNGSGQKVGVLSVIRSADQGQTWSAAIQGPTLPSFQITDPENGVPIANMASYPIFVAPAIDRSGNLYVVFEDNRFSGGQYSTIAFTMSPDGGSTWSKPIPVNQTPTNIPLANRNAFLPSVAVAGDGTIGVTYYDLRFNDPNPGLPTDYWLVQCHPSAMAPATDPANWGSEVRLTDSSFNLEGAPTPPINGGAYFLGDYEGLTTAGNDFLAAWAMPHDGDLDSVYFRDPPAVGSTTSPVLVSQAMAATDPGPLLASDALWQAPAVDAYFMDLARTSETTSSVPNGDTASAHTVGLAAPALPAVTDPVVPPPARLSGTLTSALPRRAAHRSPSDWGTAFAPLADLS
jgi:hypothetical protein